MATYQHGVSTTTGAYGLIQNLSLNSTADEAVAQDADGDVAAQTIYNEKVEASGEWVVDTDATLPSVGDSISIGGDAFKLLSLNETESNTEYRRVSITAVRYVPNTIPAST